MIITVFGILFPFFSYNYKNLTSLLLNGKIIRDFLMKLISKRILEYTMWLTLYKLILSIFNN